MNNRKYISMLGVTVISIMGLSWNGVLANPPGKPTVDVNVVNTPDVNVANVPDVVVANTRFNPVPVVALEEGADGRVSARFTNNTSCSQNGCTFACVSGQFEVPEGKSVLIETVNLAWDDFPNPYVRSNAAFQTISPEFQRMLIGEMIDVPGFTGATGWGAVTNVNIVAGDITACATFPETRPAPSGTVSTDLYVYGRLIDSPTQ